MRRTLSELSLSPSEGNASLDTGEIDDATSQLSLDETEAATEVSNS